MNHRHHNNVAFKSWKSRDIAKLAAVGLFSTMTVAGYSHAAPVTVPAGLEVPAGNVLYRQAHAKGTQNYVCLRSASDTYAWTFYAPQATLFKGENQIITHFLSTNATDPTGAQQPTWQDSEDTSTVWGKRIAGAVVDASAIPWLLVQVSGSQSGPGGDRLTKTTYIQRVNTAGGIAPATGCDLAAEEAAAVLGKTVIGKLALVPYETDYLFYKAR